MLHVSCCTFVLLLISHDLAILSLRYPISRDVFLKRVQRSPRMVRYPPLVLSFTQAHLCDAPCCKASSDSCAVPHKNKQERVLRYYRYKYRPI